MFSMASEVINRRSYVVYASLHFQPNPLDSFPHIYG